jgi:hypothetical protein
VLLDPEEGDGDGEGEDDQEVDVLVPLDLQDLIGKRRLPQLCIGTASPASPH